jgi:tol-pal system protein YbgF
LGAFPNGKFVFDARIRLGDCYYFSKDYKSAAAAYRTVTRQYAQREGVDYAVYQLGQTYFRDGDAASASQQFSTLIRSYPTSSLADDAQYALGWILFQRKSYADAIKEFQKVVTSFPSSELVPRALYSIGDSHYNLQQYAEAEKAYRQVIDRFPQSPLVADALSGIQYCLLAQGKQQEAVQVIDRYIEANPGAAIVEELQLKKADLLYNQKQYAAAVNEFQAFVSKYPNSQHAATALFWSAKSLAALNRLSEAASTFERAAGTSGASAQLAANALLEAGQMYFQQKQYDRALRLFSSLESKYPTADAAAEASYMKGRVFWENGDLQEAKNQFEFVIQKQPASDAAARSKVSLAQMSLKAGDVAKAQTFAQEVATSRNDAIGAEAQYLIASIFAERREWQNAVTAYLRVRYVFPSFEEWVTKAYLGLGIAHENLKDIPKAREAYQNALRLKKDEQSVAEAQRRLNELERR